MHGPPFFIGIQLGYLLARGKFLKATRVNDRKLRTRSESFECYFSTVDSGFGGLDLLSQPHVSNDLWCLSDKSGLHLAKMGFGTFRFN